MRVKFTGRDATWDEVQAEARSRLADCDHVMVADSPYTAECREAYRAYRAALRAINRDFPDPAAVVWPAAPQKVKHADA